MKRLSYSRHTFADWDKTNESLPGSLCFYVLQRGPSKSRYGTISSTVANDGKVEVMFEGETKARKVHCRNVKLLTNEPGKWGCSIMSAELAEMLLFRTHWVHAKALQMFKLLFSTGYALSFAEADALLSKHRNKSDQALNAYCSDNPAFQPAIFPGGQLNPNWVRSDLAASFIEQQQVYMKNRQLAGQNPYSQGDKAAPTGSDGAVRDKAWTMAPNVEKALLSRVSRVFDGKESSGEAGSGDSSEQTSLSFFDPCMLASPVPHRHNAGESALNVHTVRQQIASFTDKHQMLTKSMQMSTAMPLMVDGPYGAPTEIVFGFKRAVLVGAGIGVTPMASVLKNIAHRLSLFRCHGCHARL